MASPRVPVEEKAAAKEPKSSTSPAIKNLLTCPIRLELFFAPVALGCGHSVEQDTLPQLQACPLCRKPIPHGFEADINVVIKNLVIETIRADKSLLTDQYFSIDIWKKILKKETSYEFLAELLAVKELDTCWKLLTTELEWLNLFNDGYFLKMLDEVINRNPQHVFALAIRAVARNMKNDFDGAIADATSALKLNPNDASALRTRAVARNMKNDFDGAIADATSALRLNPNDAFAFATRADARRLKNDFDEAIADATEALRLNPNDALAFVIRGEARRMKNDFDGAIADATEALKLNPNDASVLHIRADSRHMKNDFDGAIADATSALRLNPNDAFAFAVRADARHMKNDFDGAIADATSALKLNPNDAFALRNRAESRRMKNDFDGAIADATAALKLDPNAAFIQKALRLAQNAKKQLLSQSSVSVAGLFAGGVEEKNEGHKNEAGVKRRGGAP